ncbi:MAG: radical SAM protein, partial [Gemmatimonadaceae bacterium]
SAFGRAAPLNLEFQRSGRVLPFPFHFLDASRSMNVVPKHYAWSAFYDHLLDMERHAFSWRQIGRRLTVNEGVIPKWLNLARSVSSERNGRMRNHARVRALLDSDATVRRFFEGETATVPDVYVNRIRQDLGSLWESLPEGGLLHDQNAYLKGECDAAPVPMLA